ncbi:MAG TPA: hypothetical protein VFI25_04490 [Planctomycetota bacterium]|nr:hypothetical protein [Planctomycetota bacterium]
MPRAYTEGEEKHQVLIEVHWSEAIDHLQMKYREALYTKLEAVLHRVLKSEHTLQGDLAPTGGTNCVFVGVTYEPCTTDKGNPGLKRCEKYMCDEGYQYVCEAACTEY